MRYFERSALHPDRADKARHCDNATVTRPPRPTAVHFRVPATCVRVSTYPRLFAVVILTAHVARQTEVGDLHRVVVGNEHVPRSEIAMDALQQAIKLKTSDRDQARLDGFMIAATQAGKSATTQTATDAN